MKKVLYCVNNPYVDWNPYTATIIEGIKLLDDEFEAVWGIDRFWDDIWPDYDIIHIMWPNELLYNDLRYTSEQLQDRIAKLKQKGIKIVATCHNLEPHYSKSVEFNKAYEIVYSTADVIIHLGEYSKKILEGVYRNSRHVVIYHHIYDDRYKSVLRKADAQTVLSLNKNKKYVLCFGALRASEERYAIVALSKMVKQDDIVIIAPGFCRVAYRRDVIGVLKHFYYRIKYRNIKMCLRGVPDDKVPLYFSAADVLLIMRMKILNSGNLPLGFYMGNVVVGPDMGNVGEILHDTGNVTFDPNDLNSIKDAIFQGLKLEKSGKGKENRLYAMEKYSSNCICKKILNVYNDIML